MLDFKCKLRVITHKTQRLEKRLRENTVMSDGDIKRLQYVKDITKLNVEDRWKLYRHWISILKERLLEKFRSLEQIFNSDAKEYQDACQKLDLEIMKDSHVIGMTTTFAARCRNLLKDLQPKI
ncbi:hypothetical protein L9F63_009143, partial [Diploptera punctata]